MKVNNAEWVDNLYYIINKMSEGIIKYSMSNVLIPSNYRPSKKSAIKLNRSLDNNEKILFNLP